MYSGEVVSKVMRYSNGEVSEAVGYHWYRAEQTATGHLMRTDYEGNWIPDSAGSYLYAHEYKSFSIAACNPLLPIMVTDTDPLVQETGSWDLLRLFHPRDSPGISQVVTLESPMRDGGGQVRYAAGRSPSWIPGLLPRTYRSPKANPPESLGLGGELPIILGLMALGAEKDRNSNEPVNKLFLERRAWRRNEWRGGDPRGCEYSFVSFARRATNDSVYIDPDTAQDDPCIFLVKVFLDPENPASTKESLGWFEWWAAVVRESSSQSSGSR